MMQNNYHTHTYRCHHADGDERAYVESAIASGLKVLGFSDHVPMPPFPEPDYYSTFRMDREELPDYVQTILDLKKEYANDIEILLGFEAEYYPQMFDAMLEMLSPYPYDYLIQGQHFLGNEVGDFPVSRATDEEAELARFVTQVCTGMKTGAFSYLAHPDMFRFEGEDAVYLRHMREICETANALDMPVEYNLLGLRGKRHYPSDRFFHLVAEYGCKVILGCDAHSAEAISDKQSVQSAYDTLARLGITNIVQEIRLRGR